MDEGSYRLVTVLGLKPGSRRADESYEATTIDLYDYLISRVQLSKTYLKLL